VGLVICKRSPSLIKIHWNLIKKVKEKIQWDFDPKVYWENDLSDIVHVFLENDFSKCKS
jgi:hypothetical protein